MPMPMPKSYQFLIIAGEPSGDLLGAELVAALRAELAAAGAPAPRFFGAAGTHMAAAGVEPSIDLSRFAIIGLSDVLRNLWRLRRILRETVDLAVRERPDFVVCVDYGGFNRRLVAGIRARQPADWSPRVVQYVSPQVWASRPGRARTLARDLDLLVAILPIEKPWYAARHPDLRVEFVGHPIVDRHSAAATRATATAEAPGPPRVVLLPGSRRAEIARHWPVMIEAAERIHGASPAQWRAIFTCETRRDQALGLHDGRSVGLETRIGGLDEELSRATLAIASTGTVTLECALWQVPTVAIYKASWSTAQIVRRIIRVPYLAMPNLLADARVMPELLQAEATPENLARAAGRLLADPAARAEMRARLGEVVGRLGPPGAATRAARAILSLGQTTHCQPGNPC